MPDRPDDYAPVTLVAHEAPLMIWGAERGEWLLQVCDDDGRRVLGIRWDGTYDFGEAPDPGLAGRTFVEAMLPYLSGYLVNRPA